MMAEITANERILGMLGLARRAGKLVIGTDMSIDRIRSPKKPFLCVICSDCSERTRKQLTDKCKSHGVGYIEIDENGGTLADSIGKKHMTVSAVCVCEKGIAEKIISLNNQNTQIKDNIS